jgi:hypothetical protein
MGIPDVHSNLARFYDEHVRLGTELREKLAGYRDACLERLKSGLAKLGEEKGTGYGSYQRSIGQGSYTMHTLNRHKKDEYDIDVAVVFKREDLPENPLEARKRVAEALLKAGGNFKVSPEARTNAVTVWYADGAHVDIPVYREYQGFWDWNPRLEHAGATWSARNPVAIGEWFAERVEELSPSFRLITSVPRGQLRRVVRLVKAFARSRLDWELPGGMLITILVAEVYKMDRHRDDVALYNTLRALQARLASNVEILNPVNNLSLTSKPNSKARVASLVEKLGKGLADLAVLERPACSRDEALRSWGRFFNHAFWGSIEKDEVALRAGGA